MTSENSSYIQFFLVNFAESQTDFLTAFGRKIMMINTVNSITGTNWWLLLKYFK
jgi:hypothetical protein